MSNFNMKMMFKMFPNPKMLIARHKEYMISLLSIKIISVYRINDLNSESTITNYHKLQTDKLNASIL